MYVEPHTVYSYVNCIRCDIISKEEPVVSVSSGLYGWFIFVTRLCMYNALNIWYHDPSLRNSILSYGYRSVFYRDILCNIGTTIQDISYQFTVESFTQIYVCVSYIHWRENVDQQQTSPVTKMIIIIIYRCISLYTDLGAHPMCDLNGCYGNYPIANNHKLWRVFSIGH